MSKFLRKFAYGNDRKTTSNQIHNKKNTDMKEYVFAYASEENGFTVEVHTCETLEEAQEMYLDALKELGEEPIEKEDYIFKGCDSEWYVVTFGAFEKHSSVYGDWLNLVADYANTIEECFDDEEDEEEDCDE